MAKKLQLRGGTTAEHSTFTGAVREVTVDTDKDTLVVHDGVVAGGKPVLSSTGGALTGALTTNSTFDGRDVATDGTKLDTVETNADVTDTTNVTAAGALMDSEVDADLKTLVLPASTTISTFGASLVDDATAAVALTTLGLTATTAELNYVDGVTSSIQTQLANINTDLLNDTTPQLGGNLDLNGNNITGTGTITATSFTGSGVGLTGVDPFPGGTKMVFVQASAPTGWTQDTTNNDKGLRVVSGSGGGTGGTHAFSSPPSTSHTHTGPSHTHSTPAHLHSHTLSAGAHTLSTAEMPSHSHSISRGYGTGTSVIKAGNSSGGSIGTSSTGGGGSHSHSLAGSISSGGASTSGAGGTGATGSAGPTAFAPQYVDVIVCTKD